MKTTTLSDQKLAEKTAQQNREERALLAQFRDSIQNSTHQGIQMDAYLDLDFSA